MNIWLKNDVSLVFNSIYGLASAFLLRCDELGFSSNPSVVNIFFSKTPPPPPSPVSVSYRNIRLYDIHYNCISECWQIRPACVTAVFHPCDWLTGLKKQFDSQTTANKHCLTNKAKMIFFFRIWTPLLHHKLIFNTSIMWDFFPLLLHTATLMR